VVKSEIKANAFASVAELDVLVKTMVAGLETATVAGCKSQVKRA
jgi:hypothetical protein